MTTTSMSDLQLDVFALCVNEESQCRLAQLLDCLYYQLDRDDYLDVLEYTLGRLDYICEDLGVISDKIYRVVFDRDFCLR